MADPRHAPFLRAIIDRPDDDLPRLVLADWLDEHGDGERAEFIRLQIEGRNLRRADKFLVTFARLWWPWLHYGLWVTNVCEFHVRRGFPERWVGPADVWACIQADALAAAPIREIIWTSPPSTPIAPVSLPIWLRYAPDRTRPGTWVPLGDMERRVQNVDVNSPADLGLLTPPRRLIGTLDAR